METTKHRLQKTLAAILKRRPIGFWPGFLIGIFYFGWVFFWIWSLHPLSSIGVSTPAASLAILSIGYVGSILAMAVWWGILSWLIKWGWRTTRPIVFPGYAAACFVLVEYARAWTYGIVWWGSGSVLGPHWTFGNVAYWFADLEPFRQSAAIWGIYGVEFFLMLFIAVIATLAARHFWREAIIGATIIIFSLGISHALLKKFSYEPVTPLVDVVIIQTARQTIATDNYEDLLRDFKEKLQLIDYLNVTPGRKTLIVFPEGSNFFSTFSQFKSASEILKYIRSPDSEGNIAWIDNGKILGPEGAVSRTIAMESGGQAATFYDKRVLSPWGEHLPYIFEWPLRIVKPSALEAFSDSRQLSPGSSSNSLRIADTVVGILTCSDLIAPRLFPNEEQTIILGQSSMAPFYGNRFLEGQLLAMARFRAAEQQKPLVIASNFGRSQIIDTTGKVTISAENSGYQILTGSVMPAREVSWYTKGGDVPIILLLLALLGYTWKHSLQPREKSKSSSRS